jgi:hypothetical protein
MKKFQDLINIKTHIALAIATVLFIRHIPHAVFICYSNKRNK